MSEELEIVLNKLSDWLNIEDKRKELKKLEVIVSDPDLWTKDRLQAEEKTREYGKLASLIESFDTIKDLECAKKFETDFMPKNEYESSPALISAYPGAGGEDARDWAMMLLKMYDGYAKSRSWKTEMVDDDTLEVKGEDAFNLLRKESGVHRLVRISPYDTKGLRHTSFALIEVLPDLGKVDLEKIVIPENDIKVEFSRSSGPGGQNVNKVETAVRVIHTPTGLTASAQVERSQSQNRERALNILKTKLMQLMKERKETEISNLRTKVTPEWGHQIRSYVLHPYKMVKDHRTNFETSRADEVLSGRLDGFIEAELKLTE